MRLSEIGNKEIIDLSTGSRHGQLWDSELLFDPQTGEIKAILISDFKASKQMRLEEYRQLPEKLMHSAPCAKVSSSISQLFERYFI